jgi:hypothetical protein
MRNEAVDEKIRSTPNFQLNPSKCFSFLAACRLLRSRFNQLCRASSFVGAASLSRTSESGRLSDVYRTGLDVGSLWNCCTWRTLAGVGGLNWGGAFGWMPPTLDRTCCPERSMVRRSVSRGEAALERRAWEASVPVQLW